MYATIINHTTEQTHYGHAPRGMADLLSQPWVIDLLGMYRHDGHCWSFLLTDEPIVPMFASGAPDDDGRWNIRRDLQPMSQRPDLPTGIVAGRNVAA